MDEIKIFKDSLKIKQYQVEIIPDHYDERTNKVKESLDYQNFLLMKKGLNKEFVEEFKLNKISKQFERRAVNPRINVNKN